MLKVCEHRCGRLQLQRFPSIAFQSLLLIAVLGGQAAAQGEHRQSILAGTDQVLE